MLPGVPLWLTPLPPFPPLFPLLPGIFNTLYYTVSFLVFWCWVVKVPTGQGLAATAKAFAGVMAGVWAGSQVTKAPRAAAALMLAPLVDRLMGALQRALGLRSRRQVSQGRERVEVVAPPQCQRQAWFGQCTEDRQHCTPLGVWLQVFFVFVAGCVALALTMFAAVVLAWS